MGNQLIGSPAAPMLDRLEQRSDYWIAAGHYRGGTNKLQPIFAKRGAGVRLSVSPRMRLVPAPRRLDNRFDRRVLRLPIEQQGGQSSIGNQLRRIAGAARRRHGGNRMSRDLAAGSDHLADAISPAGAEIDFDRFARL